MDCARDINKEFHLKTFPREHYQLLYEKGLAGHLFCLHCGKAVKLYLGIMEKPHFYHIEKGDFSNCFSACSQKAVENKQETLEEYTIVNGFRVPKSKKIDEKAEQPPVWKEPNKLLYNEKYEISKEAVNADLFSQISFTSNQLAAITHPKGPLLVLAGAGSGKTRVLTARAAFLMKHQLVNPGSILLVTFTAKAAREMKERMNKLYGLTHDQLNGIVSGTFHSIFYRILAHADRAKWNGQNLLKWDWQKEQYLKLAGRELDLDEKDFPYDEAIQLISYWKNTLIPGQPFKPVDQWEERVQYLFKRFEEMKQENSPFDFDDMLIGCLTLLQQNENLLNHYQQRFKHVLIDEFQDINPIQYKIMKLLSNRADSLFAVGDDDQSIYAFRGSDPSIILNYQNDFPTAKIVYLNRNYRSNHPIVSSAERVISFNKDRYQKQISASFYHQDRFPICFFPYDEEEEATIVVNDMKEKLMNGYQPSDFAILYRSHSQGRAILERLMQSSIPFNVENDHPSFYEKRIVKSLLSYLRLSLNPDDTEAIKDFLVSFFLKQSALNDLKALSIIHDCSMLDALLKLDGLHSFQKKKLERTVPLFEKIKEKKPADAIEFIQAKMGFQDYLKKRGNEGNSIEKGSDDLKDLAVVAKRFSTIEQFLEHINHIVLTLSSMKQSRSGTQNAVQLMTIHRAKGLEFQAVYVLNVVDGSIPHDFALDSVRKGDNKPLEEERRLLYVAMTRAKNDLYLSIPTKRRNQNASPSRFVRNLYR